MSWETIRVDKICRLVRGSSPRPKGDPRYYGGDVPRLMVQDLTRDGKLVTPQIDFLTQEGAKLSRPVPAGTVVMVVSGKVGQVARLAVDACIHDGFVGFLDLDTQRIDPDFLVLWLEASRHLHDKNVSGAIWKNLTTTQIKKMQVPAPPLDEQRRIAAILDKADALRRQRRAALAKLDTLLQATFLDLFGDPVTNPKGWPAVKLGELGKWRSGGTPSRSKPHYFEGTIPWLSSGELEQLYTFDSNEHISDLAVEESSVKMIEPESLLLGMYDTAALKSTITKVECTCNQAIAFSKLDDSIVNTLFVYFAIQTSKEHFRRLQRGVRQKNLNLTMIRAITLPLPPLSLQNQFADVVGKYESIQRQLSNAENKTANLFHALQQRAFRGEL